MKMRHSLFTAILVLMFAGFNLNGKSQTTSDTISFQEILSIALANNFQLTVLNNEVEIVQNNNTAGAAGLLPTVGISATNNNSVTNSRQTFYDGRVREATHAFNNSFNALASLNWTVFEGRKLMAEKYKLEELENIGIINLQYQTELLSLNLATLYYQLVQEQKLLQVLRYTLEVSRARLVLAEKKFSLGAASEVDLNQARIDWSTDSTSLIRQDVMIKNLVADINALAGRSPEIKFSAVHDIFLREKANYNSLLDSMLAQNYSLLLMRADVQVKFLNIRQKRAATMPALSLFTNYQYNTSRSETGIVETSTQTGPAFGFNLNYTLFDGLNNRREIANSKLEHQSAQVRVDETINALHTGLYKMFNTYTGAEKQVTLEQKNLENARKNLSIAIELYKSGAINEIEFRDIQRKALEAENRLLVAEYTTKIAELSLRQISGTLRF